MQELGRKRHRAGCPEAMNNGGFVFFLSAWEYKMEKMETYRKREWISVVHGSGAFRCVYCILLPRPLVIRVREHYGEGKLFPTHKLCAEDRILLCELLAFRLVFVAINLLNLLKILSYAAEVFEGHSLITHQSCTFIKNK